MSNHRQSGITVVIPAFNAASVLGDAIDSALNSGVDAIIVIDDGSTDETGSIADSKGAICLRRHNGGAAAARRAGLQRVKTEYVIFLDADDILIPEGVAAALEWLRRNVDVIGVVSGYLQQKGSSTREAAGDGHYVPPWSSSLTVHGLIDKGRSPGPPACMLWRAQDVRDSHAASPRPLSPRLAEDYESVIRLANIGRIETLPGPACLYATTGGKSSRNPMKGLEASEQIRRYYAQEFGVVYRQRTKADLVALTLYWRSSLLTTQNPLRYAFMLAAVLRSPNFFLHSVRGFVSKRLSQERPEPSSEVISWRLPNDEP